MACLLENNDGYFDPKHYTGSGVNTHNDLKEYVTMTQGKSQQHL